LQLLNLQQLLSVKTHLSFRRHRASTPSGAQVTYTLSVTVNAALVATTSALYYKHITIGIDDSSVIIKRQVSLVDKAGVVIYNRNMFIIQATGLAIPRTSGLSSHFKSNSSSFDIGDHSYSRSTVAHTTIVTAVKAESITLALEVTTRSIHH
jgi:hypothetical protein